MTRRTTCLAAAISAVLSWGASAQETPAPTEKPPPAQPTLDELLGIQKDKPAANTTKPGKPVDDPSRVDLERQLSMEEAQENFKQAVVLMGETATRIKDGRDTGLATQRLQEDIIRKLDMVITAAERQQQQQRSRSRQRPQQGQQQDQPGQQNREQNQNQENANQPADQANDPPGRQDANLRPGTAARGALWGNLPEHVRNALSQGDADKYSSLYRKWTEAYYRKLAEEANK